MMDRARTNAIFCTAAKYIVVFLNRRSTYKARNDGAFISIEPERNLLHRFRGKISTIREIFFRFVDEGCIGRFRRSLAILSNKFKVSRMQ